MLVIYETGNTEPTAECNDGYYCTLGAYTSTPTDGVTGDICPPGRYCGTGSVSGEPCPIGTFSNIEGLSNETQCEDCTPGFYCGRTGLTVESGTCWAGEFLYSVFYNLRTFRMSKNISFSKQSIMHIIWQCFWENVFWILNVYMYIQINPVNTHLFYFFSKPMY